MHIVKTGAGVGRITPAHMVTAGATVATHVSCQIIRLYTGNINKILVASRGQKKEQTQKGTRL